MKEFLAINKYKGKPCRVKHISVHYETNEL